MLTSPSPTLSPALEPVDGICLMLAEVADALRALRFVGVGWNQEGVLNPLSGVQGLDSAPNVNDKR